MNLLSDFLSPPFVLVLRYVKSQCKTGLTSWSFVSATIYHLDDNNKDYYLGAAIHLDKQ